MHKSEELQEVVNVVFEKLMELDILLDTVCINIFTEDSKNLNLWIAAPGQSYAASFHVPYIDNPLHTDIFNAKSQGVEFFCKGLFV